MGLAGVVLLHLAGAAAAAHADVLETSAEARRLVTLEVRQGDEDVGVHHGAADLGVFDILAALDRHLHLVVALQAVGDDDLAARRHRAEAVEIGGIHVVKRIFSSADIERVAVCQEGLAAALPDKIRHRFRPVRAQECEVARLSEVQLDRRVLVFEVNVAHARRLHQSGQLLLEILVIIRAQIRKINLTGHTHTPLSSVLRPARRAGQNKCITTG